jgi:hypothetical protein
MTRFFAGVAVLLLSLSPSSQLPAQDSSDSESLNNLAQELVRLRGEVESLNSELNSLTEQHRAEMNALAAQKGDLEATARREDLRIRQLEQDLADNRERASEAGLAGEALIPVAEAVIADLEATIQASLPYRLDERLDALAEIRSQLETGAQAPPRIINRLWSFYEDELRLTRENGLHTQVIPLGGQRVLSDVVKLGTVAMYFQTRDGRSGQVVRQGDSWRFQELTSAEAIDQIATLFDSMQKQIRSGYFELPNGSIALEATP